MKRFLSLLLTLILAAGCLTACSAGPAPAADKLQIVATIFPEYDWVRAVLGDNPAGAEVTLLLDSGVDLHSYQPTAADILKISGCDVFLYVGGESDDWVEDALAEASNKEMIIINLLESLGDAVKEEIVPGMQDDEDDEDDEDGEPEYDEHVWLSLRSAAVLTERIAEALAASDAANAGTYRANAAAYIGKLDALDAAYSAVVEAAGCRTLLFGDRFPFRYLTDDYGLDCYAAFSGCSAETEASFETVAFLAQQADALSLHTVLTLEKSDRRIAETIVRNTKSKDQQLLALDSLQSTDAEDVKNGVTYLEGEYLYCTLRDARLV